VHLIGILWIMWCSCLYSE